MPTPSANSTAPQSGKARYGFSPEEDPAVEAEVGPQHRERAVGEVHQAHDPQDQRHAAGNQRVDAPQEQAVEEGLHERHLSALSTFGVGRMGFRRRLVLRMDDLVLPLLDLGHQDGWRFWPRASNLIDPKVV